jgi:hypothetical protein
MTANRASIAGLAMLVGIPLAAAQDTTLMSMKTAAPPTIDGNAESAWNAASPVEMVVDKTPYEPNNGYPGVTKTKVTIRAMHDADTLYMLVQYADPTYSVERFPWVKQQDGSWKQKENKDSTKHENTYYEDKFAVLWDINARGFAKKGCASACHVAKDGMNNGIKDTAPGRKYTSRKGQSIDMWHWKSVRSQPVGQIDDQFIDDTADPSANRNWGRKGDTKAGGGYSNNKTKDGKMPAFMPRDRATGGYWLLKGDAVPFEDGFAVGDVLPGIVVSTFEGPRGDISSGASWKDGVWTIELQRKLTTSSAKAAIEDVQFSDLSKTYSFGVAVFDNSQINHVYHEGVLKLKFGK